jgi:hypothetical protein
MSGALRKKTLMTIFFPLLYLTLSNPTNVVLFLTTTCCEKVAKMLGFPMNHGQLNDEEHKTSMRKWKIGKSQWIIGT